MAKAHGLNLKELCGVSNSLPPASHNTYDERPPVLASPMVWKELTNCIIYKSTVRIGRRLI